MTYEAEPIMQVLPEIIPLLPKKERKFYKKIMRLGITALLETDYDSRNEHKQLLSKILGTTIIGFPAEGQLFITAQYTHRKIVYCLGKIPHSYGGKQPIPKRFTINHQF